MKKIYALYKGDRFIDIGTIDYLASLLKVTRRTIMFYGSPTYLKRTNYQSYVLIKLEE